MTTRLLKAKDIAEILNISRSQAFALMRNGEIPTVRFGSRCTRVRAEDLDEFIQVSLANLKVNPLKAKLAVSPASLETSGKTPVHGEFADEKV